MKRLLFCMLMLAVWMLAVSCATDVREESTTDPTNTAADTAGFTTDAEFEAGVVLLGLKEPCEKSLGEMFPTVDIAAVEDICQT